MSENALKAQVPRPPARQRGIMAEVPTPQNTEPELMQNMQTPNSGTEFLNFKVNTEFKRVFKLVAAMKGMSMKELMEATYKCWVEQYGDESVRAVSALALKNIRDPKPSGKDDLQG